MLELGAVYIKIKGKNGMSNLLKNIVLASAVLASANSAYARFDSGLFMRLDLGYGVNEKLKPTANNGLGPYAGFGTKNSDKSVVWGGALGFHYSSEIAFDLSYTTFPTAKATLEGKTNTYKLTAHGFLVNVTYYLDAHFKFKPFVYAGMGFAKSRYQHSPGSNPATASPYPKSASSDTRTGAAYNLGVGMAMPIANNISIEAKYRYHYLSGKPGGMAAGQRDFGHSGFISAKVNF